MDVYQMRLVKIGPSLRERAEQFIAGQHQQAMVNRLRRFREGLETSMAPEPWTLLEASAVTLLADICDALHLTPAEKAKVLGDDGQAAQEAILAERILPQKGLNQRSSKPSPKCNSGDTSPMATCNKFIQKLQQRHCAWIWLILYSVVFYDDKAVVEGRFTRPFEAKRGGGFQEAEAAAPI